MLPSKGSMIRSALPSTGSRRPGSPASPVLWPTPIPPRPSRRLRLPSPSGTFRRTLVRSLGRRARAGQGQVHGLRRTHVRYPRKEMKRPPRFLGDPMPACPVLRPRRVQHVRPYDVLLSPSALTTTSAPTKLFISGLDRTAYRLAVYASHRGSLRRHARLASGWWPALTGQG